jgi:hypothetical protein
MVSSLFSLSCAWPLSSRVGPDAMRCLHASSPSQHLPTYHHPTTTTYYPIHHLHSSSLPLTRRTLRLPRLRIYSTHTSQRLILSIGVNATLPFPFSLHLPCCVRIPPAIGECRVDQLGRPVRMTVGALTYRLDNFALDQTLTFPSSLCFSSIYMWTFPIHHEYQLNIKFLFPSYDHYVMPHANVNRQSSRPEPAPFSPISYTIPLSSYPFLAYHSNFAIT